MLAASASPGISGLLEMQKRASTVSAVDSADRCLTPAQLTAYFPHKTVATIKKDLSRRVDQLPPFFRVGRQTLFRESQVIAWLDQKQKEWNERGKGEVEREVAEAPRRGPKRKGG